MSSFTRPKFTTAKVRLRTSNFANYLDFYHKNDPSNDYLYKIIKKIIDNQRLLNREEAEFKNPATQEGFYFKSEKCKCVSLAKKPCLIGDILDQDVVMRLKIQPYDFSAEGKQIIGVSITALEITAVKDNSI